MTPLGQPTEGMWPAIETVALETAHRDPIISLLLVCLTAIIIVLIIVACIWKIQAARIAGDVKKYAIHTISSSLLSEENKAYFINLLLENAGGKKK